MAIDLKALSPKELQALIAGANAQMQEARVTQIRTVREKIDGLLKSAGLTLDEVYPTRGGKKAAGKKGNTGSSVAPKYRDPSDPSQTWSGRGRQPIWFAAALKKRGVTAESLLIGGAVTKAAPAKKAPAKKSAKKASKPKA
jgi:DNA-binding protein H-NS